MLKRHLFTSKAILCMPPINCQQDVLLAFTAVLKAYDHPQCLKAALDQISKDKREKNSVSYFSLLPQYLKDQIEEFLKRRYHFKSILPKLGKAAFLHHQLNFGQNGFWSLGSQALLLEKVLNETPVYQLWYQHTFPEQKNSSKSIHMP